MACHCSACARHVFSTRIGRRPQKSPSRCIFSADDLRRCRPQKVENADARRASADRLLSKWLYGKHELAAARKTRASCRKVGQASACHDLFEKWGAAALSTAASKTRLAIADCTSIRPFADFPVSLQPCRHVAAWPVANERIGEGAAEPATNFGCGHTSWSACLSAGSPARMNWLRTRVNLQ